MPLGAMLASLARHHDPRRALIVHVLGHALSAPTWQRLADSLGQAGQLHRIDVDPALVFGAGFATRAFDHISPVCFFRLLLPELLPDIGRLLYLDCDVVVCDDISALHDLPMQGCSLLAAIEHDGRGRPTRLRPQLRHGATLRIASSAPVYNVGVLLLDLAAWRRTRLAHRVFHYLREAGEDVRWYEQEALNICAAAELGELPARWNLPPLAAAALAPEQRGCIHYLTAEKPWDWRYGQPLAGEFFAALDASAWRGWRPRAPRFAPLAHLRRRLAKAWAKRFYELMRRRRGAQRGRDLNHARQAVAPTLVQGWQVHLRPGELLTDVHGVAVDVNTLAGAMPAEVAVVLAVEGDDPEWDWLELVARDQRSGALFMGRAAVRHGPASAVPQVLSRAVLVRAGTRLLIDAAGRIAAGARVAPEHLLIRLP